MQPASLPFDVAVPPDGYAWWYMDGLSDDGRFGITVIAFLGCVFSPWYRSARRRGPGVDALDHAVMNVCVYGPGVRRWAITGWPRRTVQRDAVNLQIGTSRLAWEGDGLRVSFDERSSPFRRAVRGELRIRPSVRRDEVVTLEAAGSHLWYPMSPVGRFEVTLDEPRAQFSGSAYQDANSGSEPLEDCMHAWTWLRQPRPDGTAVLYDVHRKREPALELSRVFHPNGGFEVIETTGRSTLPRGFWGVRRHSRGEARLVEAYEDGPFYTRSRIETHLAGFSGHALHEWADLDRFVRPWVQFLLPFKMRRIRTVS